MKRIMMRLMFLSALAAIGETRQDKAGLTPLYWIDLNGTESQWGSATLTTDKYGTDSRTTGFRPLSYENISYWGRKGAYSFYDARGVNFACGTGSFTMFVVARGGNDYTGDDAIVFCLGRQFAQRTASPALELLIRNFIADPSNNNTNLVAVRTWDSAHDSPRDVIRTVVPGCYAAYRYVPYAIVYDASTMMLKLYANGVEIASKTGDFTGFTDATCWWQVASVRGGYNTNVTGMRDRCGVTDFRYYTSALSAADVAAISADYPLADQTGEMPYYHYAFDGSYRFYEPGNASEIASNVCQCLGADRVCNDFNSSGSKVYYSNTPYPRNYFSEYSCEVMRDGVCAARSIPGSKNGYGDYWPLTNSFTFAISAKMDPDSSVRNAVLIGFGSASSNGGKASHGGIAIVLREKGKIGLDWWDGNRTRHEGATAYLGCKDFSHFHDIAVVHDRDAGTMSLYVDGSFHGSFAHSGFTNSDSDGVHGCWAFSSIHGGNPDGFTASTHHTVEEFRFYTKVLSAAQVAALADAVPAWRPGTDPSGRLPHYHYTFDGTVVSEGHNLLQTTGNAKADSAITVNGYRAIRSGARTAANVVSTGSNYGGYFPVDRPFTLFMSADPGYFTENACLFGIGTLSGGGVALMRRDLTTMAVGNWASSSSSTCPQTATVSDGVGGAIHAYAVNVDPVAKKVQLFVDGVAAGEPTALPHALTTGNWQFASIYGGLPSGIATNPDMLLEDFRVYVPSLSASEIAALSAAYPAWCKKDGEGNRPDYWYTFEPSGSVPQGAKLLRDGASTIRYPVGGDSPVRDGTYACTNINVTGTSYGNNGGLQVGSSFSIFISARAKRSVSESVSGVLFALGRRTDSETFAIASESTDKMSCYSFSGETKTLLVQADVPGMQEDFNAYCVTWDGTTMKFYLNGEVADSRVTGADFTGFTSSPAWQFGSIYSTGVGSVFRAGILTLEDFRIYSRALTAAEVASISAELPRWPRGALWQGGNSGTLADAVWQKWSWSAAANGDWTYSQTLASGDNAAIGASDVALALVSTGSPRLGELYVARPVELSGAPIVCDSLEVADGASFKPDGVASCLSPGRKIAVVTGGSVAGIDFTLTDEYGNKYYLGVGNKLYYGDGSFPGMLLLFK